MPKFANWYRVKNHPASCSCEYFEQSTIVAASKTALAEHPWKSKQAEAA